MFVYELKLGRKTLLSFRCTHLRFFYLRIITEARIGRLRRELELLRSHPKDERREREGGRAADPVSPTLVFCGFASQYGQKSPVPGLVCLRSVFGVPLEAVSDPVPGSVWKPLRTQFAYFCILKVKLRKTGMKIGGGPLMDFFAFGPPSVHVL